MIWNTLVAFLKKLLHTSDKKEWFEKLIENIKKQKDENNSVSFRIIDIRERGFTVKVAGLYGFIFFNHMPWKYIDLKSWEAVFPKLIDKIFYCKVYKIYKTKNIYTIIINAEIPQFKKAGLIENNEYKGIVISKKEFGIFIDIGYHFDWKCGSIVGMIFKNRIGNFEIYNKIETGHEIVVKYKGLDKNNHLVLDYNQEITDSWFEEIKELIGKTVWVKVHRDQQGYIDLMVKGKYKAVLLDLKKAVIKAENKLKDGEIIYCKVNSINRSKKILKLKWDLKKEDTNEQSESKQIGNINKQSKIKKTGIINKKSESNQIQRESKQIGNIVDDEVKKKLLEMLHSKEQKS